MSLTDSVGGGVWLVDKIVIDDKIRRCIECNQPLARNKEGIWSCPSGCGMWHLNADKAQRQMVIMVKYIGSVISKEPLPVGNPGSGKGSSKSGRKRKKPLKKRRPWDLQ